MTRERSPGVKLVLVGLVGAALVIPLLMVYWLVSDRQHQARVAQQSVTAAWAGPQVVSGPLLVVPYRATRETREQVEGKTVARQVQSRQNLYISPSKQTLASDIDPEVRTRGVIHRSVVYDAAVNGGARFDMPEDLDRLGVRPDQLILDEAVLQLPISDPRGLQTDATLKLDGKALDLRPGLGTGQQGSGVHAFVDWSEGGALALDFAYRLRGSSSFSMVPRGEETELSAKSSWPHPSFSGGFLPGEADREISADGFNANWSISNLALGQSLVSTSPPGHPVADTEVSLDDNYVEAPVAGTEQLATIRLIEPVDLYKRVERALKYGFLFIGFTFAAFLMFDIVAGARVASAEYLLTGAGLILFFVMLLAFAELIGFAAAYVVASAAVIGLLTSYSAAVLGGWKRAGMIAALLTGLYAVLYVLLNLESWSLMIGSLLLFVALAGVMYATRNIDWSQVRISDGADTSGVLEEGQGGIPA